MIRVVKLKPILIAIVVVVITVMTSVGVIMVSGKEAIPRTTFTIVVDAGHGGRDDGCSGKGGVKESEINLKIAKLLKTYLETLDINVVMTRCDGNGLYDAGVDNYKQSDMEKRLKIIEEANPNMVISIHQNSFADSSQRGAQAFYQENDEVSRAFAESVQNQLIAQLSGARLEANDGDYYLLKEASLPAIIVECGYLSNVEEEQLLNTSDYQEKVAYAIMCGVVKYFGLHGN